MEKSETEKNRWPVVPSAVLFSCCEFGRYSVYNKESDGNEQRDRQGKVVQQQKGIWFHREGCRRGCVCPLFGHRERRIQDPEGRRQRGIHNHAGSERIPGGER